VALTVTVGGSVAIAVTIGKGRWRWCASLAREDLGLSGALDDMPEFVGEGDTGD
jgi:hypothetical protein